MSFLSNPKGYTAAEFDAFVRGVKWNGWRPKFITLHNTAEPSLRQWANGNTHGQSIEAYEHQRILNLNHYYKGMGWHCFSGDEQFHTSEGLKTFAECAGKSVEVLTPGGYVVSPVHKFGEQELYRIRLVQVTPRVSGNRTWYSPSASTPVELLATRDHNWPLVDGTLTQSLQVGDVVQGGQFIPDEECEDFRAGFRHGFIYGDGWVEKKRDVVTYVAGIHGRKETAFDYFDESEERYYPSMESRSRTYRGTVVVKSDRNLKELATLDDGLDYLAGFIRGWCTADGGVKRNTTYKLSSAKREALEWVLTIAPHLGINVSASECVTVSQHGEHAFKEGEYYSIAIRIAERPWRVESIEYERRDSVYCAVLPTSDKLFVLKHGILTHNSGPHLFVSPAYVWDACDLTADGVHVSCWNHVCLGIEMVGDYGIEDFATGDGAKVRDLTVSALASLHNALGLRPDGFKLGVSGLHFHKECVRDHHDCPGKHVDKADVVKRVLATMKPPVAAAPAPVAKAADAPAVA